MIKFWRNLHLKVVGRQTEHSLDFLDKIQQNLKTFKQMVDQFKHEKRLFLFNLAESIPLSDFSISLAPVDKNCKSRTGDF